MRLSLLLVSAVAAVAPSTVITTAASRVVDFDCGYLMPELLRYNVRYDATSRNVSGSAKIRVERVPSTPSTIEVDATNGHLYVGSDAAGNTPGIYRYNLDGTGMVTVSDLTRTLPTGSSWRATFLRLTATHMYFVGEPPWAAGSTAGWTINKVSLTDYTQYQQLWASGKSDALAMDLDKTNNKIYFMDASKLYRMELDGTGLVTLANVSNSCSFGCAMVVVPAKNQIWWAGTTSGYLWRMNMDGTGQTDFSNIQDPWYTAGGQAFNPFFPDRINAFRYDPTDDAVYFASDDYLLAGPTAANTPDQFWAGMTVKLDFRYMQVSDFVIGWNVPSRGETACRVPCDVAANQCNGRGMCRPYATDVTLTTCICPYRIPVQAPKVVWGPHCTFLPDPCTSTAVQWDGTPLCASPRWNTKCGTDYDGNKSFDCNCPVNGEGSVWQASGNLAVCTCPANNPRYVVAPVVGIACGACTGAACLCKSDAATVFDGVLAACGCVNGTDCGAKVCTSGVAVSAACKSAMTTMRWCYPDVNKTADQLLLANTLLGCDRMWFDIPGVAPTPRPGSPTFAPGAPTPVQASPATSASIPSVLAIVMTIVTFFLSQK